MPVMKSAVKESFKRMLTILGSRCPTGVITASEGVLNYLELGRWMRAKGFQVDPFVVDRWKVFDEMAREVAERRRPLPGIRCRPWRLDGVLGEAFETSRLGSARIRQLRGPPREMGNANHDRSHFSTGGQVPVIDDPRVRFYKGWFADILPGLHPARARSTRRDH